VTKVVHLTSVHSPFDVRIFHKQAKTLVKAGYDVTLIAQHEKEEIVDGVRIIALPNPRSRFVRMFGLVWQTFYLAKRQGADIYHFHDPELLPVGILLKLMLSTRVIYDVHENHPKKIMSKDWLLFPLRVVSSRVLRSLEWLATLVLDGFVCVTEQIAKKFPPQKTRVVKNYPLLAMMPLTSAGQRNYEDNHTLIYTGGLTRHRGIKQIVQALEYVKTPRTRLILLGGRKSSEASLIQSLPGWEEVDYYAQVPFEEVYRHMQLAAIGLVCNQPVHSYDSAQPNKMFEYMAAGLPVIASHFDLWREVIEGNECGVTVDPTSPSEIAKAIDYLLDQPELRRLMGRNAQKAVREKYSWEAEGQKLISFYQEILH
jgi:glycosyltransferase involved in cell wall biosynthesis